MEEGEEAVIRAAGILFRDPAGRVLVLRRPDGRWSTPGGKLEAQESSQQAARRETYEETGYRYAGELKPLMLSDNGHVSFVTFGARVPQFKPRLNAEHSAAKWVGLKEARGMELHPGLRGMLARVGG